MGAKLAILGVWLAGIVGYSILTSPPKQPTFISYMNDDGRPVGIYETSIGITRGYQTWEVRYNNAERGDDISVKCANVYDGSGGLFDGPRPKAVEMSVAGKTIMSSTPWPNLWTVRTYDIDEAYGKSTVISTADSLCAEVKRALNQYKIEQAKSLEAAQKLKVEANTQRIK